MKLNTIAAASLNSLVVGSGFYITQISTVSPIYPLLLISILLYVPVYFSGQIYSSALSSMVDCIFLIATMHFIGYLVWVSPINSATGFYLNFVFLALALHILQFNTFNTIKKSATWLVNFTIGLGIVETLVRWFYPFQDYSEDFLHFVEESGSYFYLYKFNSIMYQDSNFVATWLLVILVFLVEFFDFKKSILKVVVLTALVVLTICRSAIFALVLYGFLKFATRTKRFHIFTIIGSILVLSCFVYIFGDNVFNDDSFQTKLLIFDLSISNYLGKVSVDQFILGAGLSKSAEILGGIAAHNVFLELLLDVGLLGLTYTIYALLRLASFSRASGFNIILVYFVSGMSFAPMTVPYLFVTLTLLAFKSRYISGQVKSPISSLAQV